METAYNSDQWKFMEEMCILVDDHDNQIGSESKKTCHLRNKETGETLCHRAFSVFLFDSTGRLLLQRRSGDKITFPMYWANTCCSHPLNVDGETETINHLGVKRAAIRKLNHELGIPLTTFTPEDFTNVLVVKYNAPSDAIWGENEIDHVLVVQKDVDLSLNKEEVHEVRYCTFDEVMQLLDSKKDLVSPWFEKICRYYLKEIFSFVEKSQFVTRDDIVVFYFVYL